MTRRTTNRTKPDAEAAYLEAHSGALDLVERIQDLLGDLPAPGTDGFTDAWGRVGDLAEVNRRLAAVAAFLAGEES